MTDLDLATLVALWTYDQFPYLLGGHVTRMDPDGAVETREFGKGHWFIPIKLLPAPAGEALLEQLKTLKAKRDTEMRAIDVEWRRELEKLCPFVKGKS